MGKVYYYMRISTKEERELQKYARQEKAIQNYCKNNGLEYKERNVYRDDCSGSSFNRSEWQEIYNDAVCDDTIVFKDLSRLTRETEEGYKVYMELLNRGVNLVFIDNPTISTDYIKKMTQIAETQNIVTRTALEGTIKLLLIVELDRVQKEREIICQRIADGISASSKKSGRKTGSLDKMSDELKEDIKKYLNDRSIKQIDLMKKYNISRNTLKKYVNIISKDAQS